MTAHGLSMLMVAALLAACAKPADEAAVKPVEKGAAAKPAERTAPEAAALPAVPTLNIVAIDGKPYDLSAHRGKWVLVNFWATWCAPCLKEMPELSALDAMREHIEVVGLAYEEIEPGEMRAFLARHPVVYPIAIVDVYDPPKDFETPRGLPMTYLIAPDGKLAKRFLGPVTAKEVESVIEAAGGPKADA
jgi:thiol-disulfide isomerase/thioredoxin